MTNREKYKQAFSAIHASNNFSLEVDTMEKMSKKVRFKTLVATVAACAVIVSGATAAYATNLGGIQRTLQLWMHGDQTEVTIQFDGDGSYQMQYPGEDGSMAQQGGGGVAIESDGSERPLTQEELMEHLTVPEVRYEDDGSVWVYWFDQKIDITDKFEHDVCYVKLVNSEKTLYMTVNYQNGFSTSSRKYLPPRP